MPTTRYNQPNTKLRTLASVASTAAITAVAVGTPIAVFFAMTDNGPVTPFHIAATVAAFVWLCGLYTFISRSVGPGVPLIVVAPIRRHMLDIIDISAFGAGPLRGWSTTNPQVALTDVSPPHRKTAVTTDDTEPEPQAPATASAPAHAATRTHLTGRGDTLWALAEHYLGDGSRWTEIAEVNHGRTVTAGVAYPRDNVLSPGWQILVPDTGATE